MSIGRSAGALKLVKKWNKKVRLLGMPNAAVEVLPILLQVGTPQLRVCSLKGGSTSR